MIQLRRPSRELRVEMAPLIDVVFLLLTFFVYSMILMVRAEILPMELRQFRAATPARPQPAAVISVDLDGRLYLDREETSLEDLLPQLLRRRAETPEVVIYLAVADGAGTVDRAPLLQDIWDVLKDAGLDINLVGRPKNSPSAPPSGPVPAPDASRPTAPATP